MKLKESFKKYWLVIVVIAALVVFFYPKYCGNWATTAPNMGYTYQDCTCFGIKMDAEPVSAGGGYVNCWGIITSRSCYENRRTEEQGSFRYYKSCEEVEQFCSNDSDCVPAQCCHPTSCINRNFKPVCEEVCSMVCEPGTMDCGAGYCACVNNKCQAVVTG